MENKHSRLGITSFVLSVVTGISMLLLFTVAGILHMREPLGSQEQQMVIGAIAIALLFLDLIAAAFGIATLCQKEQKKLFGILGLSFSLLVIIVSGGLIILGIIASKLR
jgi:hypothetical protein